MTGYLIILLIFLLLPGGEGRQFYPEPIQEECIKCHGDLIKNTVVHPQLESTCDICHAPSGSDHPGKGVRGFSLTERLPSLCFNCHSEFQDKLASSLTVHGPLNGPFSCLNCHNPHSSPNMKLLTDGSNNLCLNCHNKTVTSDSLKVKNIGQIISSAKSIHQAIDGGCVICHNPHFSEKRKLLTGNFTGGYYVKATTDDFELCFMCHDADLLEAKSTEFSTNFRNGRENLHFLHVNREKGRNCTMCHDVHGAANDRLIVDKLKFGNWEMKFGFELTGNGGSCLTACHSEKNYDRTIPKEVPPVPKQKTKK